MSLRKVSELSGVDLDYAVALCEGFGPGEYMRGIERKLDVRGKVSTLLVPINRAYVHWSPTTLKQGDDIIDRELLATAPAWHNAGYDSPTGFWYWKAYVLGPENLDGSFEQEGPTRRIAAMRCFVCSKLGPQVELPDELA